MDHETQLKALATCFATQRPDAKYKRPPKGPTTRQKVFALRKHIERLIAENYSYDGIVETLAENDVKLSVATLKTYLREARKLRADCEGDVPDQSAVDVSEDSALLVGGQLKLVTAEESEMPASSLSLGSREKNRAVMSSFDLRPPIPLNEL